MREIDERDCRDGFADTMDMARSAFENRHPVDRWFAETTPNFVEFARLVTEAKREALRDIYEVWAGSEGVPIAETATEAYLLRLIEQMRDKAKEEMK